MVMLLVLSSSLKIFCMFAECFYIIAKEVLYYSLLLCPELKLYLSHSCPTPNINLFSWLFSNNQSEEKKVQINKKCPTVHFRQTKGKVILNKISDLLESKYYSYIDVQWGAGTISWAWRSRQAVRIELN